MPLYVHHVVATFVCVCMAMLLMYFYEKKHVFFPVKRAYEDGESEPKQ